MAKYFNQNIVWLLTWLASACLTTLEKKSEQKGPYQNDTKKDTIFLPSQAGIQANRVAILRIWQPFEPEKLQNRGSENDLMPLPNTPAFPYIKTIIEASTRHPQILLYNGEKLSNAQINAFEELHKQAQAQGGKLFLINLDTAKDQMAYAEHLLTITNHKADYVDLLRLVALYNMDKVLDIIELKYRHKLLLKYLLYADFDRKIEDLLTEICQDTAPDYTGIKLPISIYGSEGSSSEAYPITIENNFILCTSAALPSIEHMITQYIDTRKNGVSVFASTCYVLGDSFKGERSHPSISRILIQEGSIQVQFKSFTSFSRFMELFKEKLAFGIRLSASHLEGTRDRSWDQNINEAIIEHEEGNTQCNHSLMPARAGSMCACPTINFVKDVAYTIRPVNFG